MIFRNFKNRSRIALVIDWKFHRANKWVSAFSPYFVNAFIKAFNPIIISSKYDYLMNYRNVNHIVSMEPRWAAPEIKFKANRHKVYALVSDPHNKVNWWEKYVDDNNISNVLSMYYHPFFYHFPRFDKSRFIHFPWAVPDEFVQRNAIEKATNDEVAIFGGRAGDAYDMRNWCRSQPFITNYKLSGVENKSLKDEEFYRWLAKFNAIVCAGSTNPKYDLVTPKYFEVMGCGALLIGQYCKDLDRLGISKENALIFHNKEEFNNEIASYRKAPDEFLSLRNEGISLIRTEHTISKRIDFLKSLFQISVS